jgi:hypothetical protein
MKEFLLVHKAVIEHPKFTLTIEPSKGTDENNCEVVTINCSFYNIVLRFEKSTDKLRYLTFPIVYSEEDELLEELKLLENTAYDIEIEHNNLPNVKLMPKLHSNSSSPLIGKVKYKGTIAFAKANWKSYVGKDILSVFWSTNDSFELPVEIRTSKLEYIEDYKIMVDDINKVSSEVIWSNKTHTSLNVVKNNYQDDNRLLSKFFFIRSWLTNNKLLTNFQEIINAPISKLEGSYKTATVGEVSSFDDKTVISMINSSDWDTVRMPLPNLQSTGNALPLTITDYYTKLSYDTIENRFIKFVLETISEILNDLLIQYKKDTFVGIESYRLLSLVQEMHSHYILQEVKSEPYTESGNLAIRRVSGYSDFYNFYEQLEMSDEIGWEDLYRILFHKQIKPVYDIYEAWVLTEFVEVFKKLSSNVDIEIGKGKKFIKKITANYHTFKLELHYQYNIKHSEEETFISSYSMRMDPDFLLNLYKGNNYLGSIVFDAKYKLNNIKEIFKDIAVDEEVEEDDTINGEISDKRIAKRIDLMTMHGYKDSIRGVLGSYVILPSNENTIELWKETKNIIPSIGALPLYPSKNKKVRDNQRKVVASFIKKFITNRNRKST